MPVDILESANRLLTIKLTGQLKKRHLDAMQVAAIDAMRRWGKIKVLILTENFTGWEPGADWGDVGFIEGPGRSVEKLAIVGDEKWKELAYAFTARSYRSTAIEYFSASERDRATAWLQSSASKRDA
jgi:hypothetical protein